VESNETILKYLVIKLDDNVKDVFKYINIKLLLCTRILIQCQMEVNIWFKSPKHLEKWGSFDNHPKMKILLAKLKGSITLLWDSKIRCLSIRHLFFSLSYDLGEITFPRRHTDFNSSVIKWEEENLECASCIGSSPIHLDGCMILVWTEGVGKMQGLLKKKHWMPRENSRKLMPSQDNIICLSLRAFLVVLPGNTIHAGGSCFGSKFDYSRALTPRTSFFRVTDFTILLLQYSCQYVNGNKGYHYCR